MNCSESLRDIAALSSLPGCLHHWESQASITSRETHLEPGVEGSQPALGWTEVGNTRSWWTGTVFSPSGTFPAGQHRVLLSAALHRASRDRTQMRSTQSSGCPWAQGQNRRAVDICTYLQLLGELLISCSAIRLCPSQAEPLIWEWAQGFLQMPHPQHQPSLKNLGAQRGVQCPLKAPLLELTHRRWANALGTS